MSLISSDTNESNDASTLGVIIGAIMGTCSMILVVLIILMLVAYTRKKRKLDKNKYTQLFKCV